MTINSDLQVIIGVVMLVVSLIITAFIFISDSKKDKA